MEQLLKEIIDGKKQYEKHKKDWIYIKGKGSKQYVLKRIDILREQLLEMKKELLEQ